MRSATTTLSALALSTLLAWSAAADPTTADSAATDAAPAGSTVIATILAGIAALFIFAQMSILHTARGG